MTSRGAQASGGTGRRPRIFYGWYIVAVMFLTGAATALWQNPSLSVLLKPMTEEFGWSRSTFTGATTIGTLLGGLLALWVGPSIDRFGAKWVLFWGFLISGALFLLLSRVQGLFLFFFVLIVGRLILQGIFNVANAIVVPNWFVRQRGRATGISSLGVNFGTGVLPLISQRVADIAGWRSAAVFIGLAAWAITLGPIFLWLKRRPEDIGLKPDGDAPAESASSTAKAAVKAPAPVRSYTLREVLRLPSFYLLLLGFCTAQFVVTGINFNLLPYLTDQGLDTTHAVLVVSVYSLIALPTTFAAGFLAERVPHRFVLVAVFAGLATGTAILTMAHSFAVGMAFAIVYGTFNGILWLYQTLTFADYYGRNSLGKIRGFITVFFMLANSMGPFLATLVYDVTGSYLRIFLVYVGMSVVVTVCMFFAKPPVGSSAAARSEVAKG